MREGRKRAWAQSAGKRGVIGASELSRPALGLTPPSATFEVPLGGSDGKGRGINVVHVPLPLKANLPAGQSSVGGGFNPRTD